MNLHLLLTIYFMNNFDFLKPGACRYDPKDVVLNISRWNYVSCDGFPGCTRPNMDEEAMARAVFKAPIIAHIYASWFVKLLGHTVDDRVGDRDSFFGYIFFYLIQKILIFCTLIKGLIYNRYAKFHKIICTILRINCRRCRRARRSRRRSRFSPKI